MYNFYLRSYTVKKDSGLSDSALAPCQPLTAPWRLPPTCCSSTLARHGAIHTLFYPPWRDGGVQCITAMHISWYSTPWQSQHFMVNADYDSAPNCGAGCPKSQNAPMSAVACHARATVCHSRAIVRHTRATSRLGHGMPQQSHITPWP